MPNKNYTFFRKKRHLESNPRHFSAIIKTKSQLFYEDATFSKTLCLSKDLTITLLQMNYFNWKKIYETGISEIDKQHKKLFELVNEFFNELFSDNFTPHNRNIHDKLNELNSFYKFHYEYERNLYSNEIITKYFDSENLLSKEIFDLKMSDKDVDIIVLYRFAEFLRKWLVKHTLILNNKSVMKDLIKDSINISCN